MTINLRYPSAGETSGTLIRLLGLGKAVVVSNTGAFAEIPDDCCAKIDLDATEEELLFAVLRALATDPELRRRMGENARRHIATHHSLEGSARAYADFVRATVAARPEPFRAGAAARPPTRRTTCWRRSPPPSPPRRSTSGSVRTRKPTTKSCARSPPCWWSWGSA